MSSQTISVKGIDKAAILAALYNASRPQGLGFLHYKANPMTVDEARELLKHGTDFDYLQGRVMKIDVGGDDLYTGGYDMDNGEGAAARVIEELTKTNNVNPASVRAAHHEGKLAAALDVKKHLGDPSELRDNTLKVGFADVADVLAPAVNRAVRMGWQSKSQTEKPT